MPHKGNERDARRFNRAGIGTRTRLTRWETRGAAEAFVEIAIPPWVARYDYRAVKADVLLWGHMLNADLNAAPPPPGPSAVPVQSGSDKAANEHADRHLHLNLGRHGKPAH